MSIAAPDGVDQSSGVPTALYHGSREKLEPGTILRPGGMNPADMTEKAVEQYRPPGKLSRAQSVFMVDDPGLVDEAGGCGDFVHSVEPIGSVEKNDVAWYNDLIRAAEDGAEAIEQEHLAKAYWSGRSYDDPDLSLFEYRAPAARIVGLLS